MIRMLPPRLRLITAAPALAQDLVTPSDRVSTHVNIRATPQRMGSMLGICSSGEGYRWPVRVNCSRSVGCGVKIGH